MESVLFFFFTYLNMEEPLLNIGNERYVILPVKYKELWEKYKAHVACFWTAEEIDLDVDIKDWQTLNEGEKYFIKKVLAFFAASDGIVNENLALRFYDDVKAPEARAFYSFQMAMETIHSETYSLLIDTLIKDEDEKQTLFSAIDTYPEIGLKADWCKKWISSSSSFSTRLVAFACVEGIFFSGSFASIFWLKKRGLMPGLTFSNELISRDEGLHTEFACNLYSLLENKLEETIVHSIVSEAVTIESNFITCALPCALLGMNNSQMIQYIKYVSDRLLNLLGYNKIYNVQNPFDWMDLISLQGKTNFFEKRVGEYQKNNVMASLVGREGNTFSTEDDF